ncbi:hypothetical protein BB560_000058 [Smittium megazygosporum]|uniref:Uncharacterized protein n=1 Tax=Smittium megazygosporum TaxID=133381 RepID=A0A2T9ZLF1_9FUNG|nr:hypothetical protein BB560_000058 [Smittium megazygosporum]
MISSEQVNKVLDEIEIVILGTPLSSNTLPLNYISLQYKLSFGAWIHHLKKVTENLRFRFRMQGRLRMLNAKVQNQINQHMSFWLVSAR